MDSLLHDISYFRFLHDKANNEDPNKEIAVEKVEFLYDESIRRACKGKKVDIAFEVCDEEPKFSEEKNTEPQGKVLKAFLVGDPRPPAEDGHVKNENSAAYFLHVLYSLTHYMIHDLIVVEKEDTEYRDMNDRLCSKQNNSNSRIPIKKTNVYIKIPDYEQLISNDEDKEGMRRPACKEQFIDLISQLIKFVTEIVRTILGNMASDSKDKQFIDSLFGEERVRFDDQYLWVDDKYIKWEDYMHAIKISQGELA